MGGLTASIPLLGGDGGAFGPPSVEFDQSFRVVDELSATKRYDISSAFGIGVAPAQTPTIRPGRIIAEVVNMQSSITPALIWTWTVTEQTYMASALGAAVPVILSAGIGIAPALTTSLAVTVLQGLGIVATPLPSLTYTQTLVAGIGMSDAFRSFFGGSLNDSINITETLATQFVAHPSIADGIGIAPALSNHFYIRVTMADAFDVTDASILQMIYDGQLADDVQIVVGYVSPNGQFTTWAINTRSGAVTEYNNYTFNSFAQLGDRYYGASDNGLYELLGDNDDGTNIVATIKSGFAQWAGSKFTMFKGVYLGVHGSGTFVLKLITGDNKTYTYTVNAQSQKTTKIVTGKGLRARYWAFELTSSGQDFDLDTIEFVPIVADRRV